MNNDMESKLNELLKMKDELDDLKSERKQQETIDDFEKKQKTLKFYYWIWIIIMAGIAVAGVAGMEKNSDPYKWNGLFMALVGMQGAVMIKLWYFIKDTKLSVLQGMKQLQIQIARLESKNGKAS
jgi:dolichyl-phosphate-mannose--protein O-mannosyl transferase